MTPSRLLTVHPSPTSDCTKRHVALPPFGFVTTQSPTGTVNLEPTSTSTTPTTTTGSESGHDASLNRTVTNPDHNTLVARPWTGAPIRAILPLPRRKLGTNFGAQNTAPSPRRVPSYHCHGAPPYRTRSAHSVWDTDSEAESADENENKDEEDGGSDEDGDVAPASRCCSYESITAAQGLSAWSFEELRVECYAQSSVARGTKPPPVVQPALAIPPAFVPRSVPRSETWRSLPTKSNSAE